ncbi:PREDICTED: uncharacterized protein LOC109206977 [Nicotiana attenuata]|uniref:uncharacterized protein LOC109206977 n=1 Tax=Nicotiana attenuata TaxID=49451 RepID=UPI00090483B8|nr:PREDICTED: uncharacterized protein LOC109206977 [Nicotiana attenuata]
MAEIIEFKECVTKCTLQDMKSSGAFYTWNNKQGSADRVYSRIDRVLINNDWILATPDSEVFYRNEGTFDHCPAIIRWAEDQKKQHIFRYFNMWSIAPKYKETGKLQQLNKQKFSQIEKKADQAYEELLQCQQRLQQTPLNLKLQKEEARLIRKTKRLKEAKHQFLRQKSKVQWLEQGDLNTKYFHSMMKARRNMNRVFSITDAEGIYRTEVDEIAKAFTVFYTNLLGTSNRQMEHVNSRLIQQGPIVTERQRSMLEEEFTEKEVKTALWAIN